MPDALSYLLLILRGIHLLGGVAWIGTIFFLGMVELPSMRRGRAGSFSSEFVSRLNGLLVVTSMSSVVAGVSMALLLSGLNTGIFISTNWGLSIFLGGLVALGALVATFAGVLPVLERLSSEELQASEWNLALSRAQKWLNITIVLGAMVLLMMASASTL